MSLIVTPEEEAAKGNVFLRVKSFELQCCACACVALLDRYLGEFHAGLGNPDMRNTEANGRWIGSCQSTQ